jgi:hypothetical protein
MGNGEFDKGIRTRELFFKKEYAEKFLCPDSFV